SAIHHTRAVTNVMKSFMTRCCGIGLRRGTVPSHSSKIELFERGCRKSNSILNRGHKPGMLIKFQGSCYEFGTTVQNYCFSVVTKALPRSAIERTQTS